MRKRASRFGDDAVDLLAGKLQGLSLTSLIGAALELSRRHKRAVGSSPSMPLCTIWVLSERPWGRFRPKCRVRPPKSSGEKISNLRNVLVHSRWQIDLEIIGDVIENRLGPLIAELDQPIAIVERSET